MISIKRLRLKNFVTYKDQIFEFDDIFKTDNKILISGKNLDDSSFANNNGAGKSLIYEAILFCLFNKTTKNSNKNGLIGKASKSMSTELLLSDQQQNEFWIKRYRKDKVFGNGIRFKINGNEIIKTTPSDTSKYMINSLGLSYQRVVNTSIFESQDERSRFVYLGDKAAKELLSQIRGIDIFIFCHKIANDKLSAIKKEIDKVNIEKSNLKWKLNELKKELIETEKLISEFKQNKKKKIAKLNEKLKQKTTEFNNEIEKTNNKITETKEKIEKSKKKLIKQNKILSLKSKLKKNQKIKSKLLQSKSIISSEIEKHYSLIESIKSKEPGNICEYCGSEISKKNLKSHKKKLIKQTFLETKAMEEINEQISKTKDKEESIQEKIDRFELKNHTIEKKIFKLKSKLKELELSLKTKQQKFDFLIKTILERKEEIDNEKNFQAKNIVILKERITKIRKKLLEINNDKKSLSNQRKYYSLWHDGYNKEEIQTYALKSTIIRLNHEIQRISDILTDGMIEIELLTSKTQGNKTIRNIFELNINDLSKKGLPFKEWSKGQKKRIEIIMSFALMNLEENLILEIFLDELFDGIDRVGISKIITLLDNEIQNHKRFMVFSHSESVKSFFSNKGVVTLKNGISTFSL